MLLLKLFYNGFGVYWWNCITVILGVKFIIFILFCFFMNVLFVCNQNENRSKTAAELFKDKFNTKSAGLYSQHMVSAKEILWSDVVVVMEEEQRSEIAKRFPKEYLQKRVLSFDIPDIYHHKNPQLIKELNTKLSVFQEFFIEPSG